MNSVTMLYCRFCAEKRHCDDLMDFSLNVVLWKEILEKLTVFIPNCIDFSNEKLPKTICKTCDVFLTSTKKFFDIIKASQTKLSELANDLNIEPNYYLDNNEGSTENLEGNDPLHILYQNKEDNIPLKTDVDDVENIDIKEENDVKMEKHDNKVGSDDEKMDYDEDSVQNDAKKVLTKSRIEIHIQLADPNEAVNNDLWTSYPWICRFCQASLKSIAELRVHCQKYHFTCNGFQCADCDIQKDSFREFYEHAMRHRVGLSNYCPYCCLKMSEEQADSHIAVHVCQPTCYSCGQIFPSIKVLKGHTKQFVHHRDGSQNPSTSAKARIVNARAKMVKARDNESWKEYPWICQECMTTFSSLDILKAHLKESHNKCFGIQCADCSWTIKVANFKEFIEHAKKHRPNLKYFCPYCNYKFADLKQRSLHINEHLSSHQMCNVCGELFQSHSDYEKHKEDYLPKEQPKRRKGPWSVEDLTCPICFKLFDRRGKMKCHEKTHSKQKNKNFRCEICDQDFSSKGSLNTHKSTHQKPKAHVCKICNNTYLSLERLKNHVRTHQEKKFQCDTCQRWFRLKCHLRNHLILHSDRKPFACQYCGKMFRYENVLRVHENLHTGAKSFDCTDCTRKFTNWSNCNKHMKRKHGKTIAKNVITPLGKVAIDAITGEANIMQNVEDVKEWTTNILKKPKNKAIN